MQTCGSLNNSTLTSNPLQCRESTYRAQFPLVNIKGHIKSWIAGANGSQPAQIPGIYCNKCKKDTYIGYGGKPTLGKKSVVTPFATVNNCCNQGSLFGIWIFLSVFDKVELEVQRKALENTQTSPGLTRDDTGTAYATSALSYTPMKYQQQDDLTDTLMTQLLVLLTALLPMSNSNFIFGKELPT
jgi:hypothetical protein